MEEEKKNIEVESTISNEKTQKKKKGKKIIIILIIAILIILSAVLYRKANSKEKRAEEVFGNDACEAILHMSTMDIAKHECKICGKQFEDSSMHADICKQCAEETGRCEFCGKILSKELKAQRENILENQ